MYDYESERRCDAHVATFLECIDAVKNVTPEGFAAIKVREGCYVDEIARTMPPPQPPHMCVCSNGNASDFFRCLKSKNQVTALGNPALLERMSACIVELRRLFKKFDTQVRSHSHRMCLGMLGSLDLDRSPSFS